MQKSEKMNSFEDLFFKELQKEALKRIAKIVFVAMVIASILGAIKYFWM